MSPENRSNERDAAFLVGVADFVADLGRPGVANRLRSVASSLAAVERERADLERECYERSLEQQAALARIAAVEARNVKLISALERTEHNFRLAVAGKPVRDMCENLAENAAALAASPTPTIEQDANE